MCLCVGFGNAVFADYVVTSDQVTVFDGPVSEYDNYSHPLNADVSGNGWRWEASSKTMTL